MNITRLKSNRRKWEYKLAQFTEQLKGYGLPNTYNEMRKVWRDALIRMREKFNADRLKIELEDVGIVFDGDKKEIDDTIKNNIGIAVKNTNIPMFNLGDVRRLTPLYEQALIQGKNTARRRVKEQIEDGKIVERADSDTETRNKILAMLSLLLVLRPSDRRASEKLLLLAINRSNGATLRRIEEIVKIAYREGISYAKLASRINSQMRRWSSYRAKTLARTETETLAMLGMTTAYAAYSVKFVTWECGLDPCPLCQPNCGQQERLGLAFHSGDQSPPVHPNCVCTLIPIVNQQTMLMLGYAANSELQLI